MEALGVFDVLSLVLICPFFFVKGLDILKFSLGGWQYLTGQGGNPKRGIYVQREAVCEPMKV